MDLVGYALENVRILIWPYKKGAKDDSGRDIIRLGWWWDWLFTLK